MTYGHLQADCLYTGISSGPNARCRVWESLYQTCVLRGCVQKVSDVFTQIVQEIERSQNVSVDSQKGGCVVS